MKAHWQLWLTPDGDVRWIDPESPWHVQPPPPFELKGTYTVERWHRVLGKLPRGALRGDPAKQVYGMGGPHYLYVDQRRKCRDCKVDFVFRARTQKRWYEERQIWNEVVMHRCGACRKAWRERREAQKRLFAAHEALRSDDGPAAQLELAEATLAAAEHIGAEAVRRAIGAARKAQRDAGLEVQAGYVERRLAALLEPGGRLP